MKRDGERPEWLPSWEDLSLSERVDAVTLPFLIPAFLWLMYYLTGSE